MSQGEIVRPADMGLAASAIAARMAGPVETLVLGKKVYESLTAYANNGYQWFQVCELAFDSFMARHALS